MHTHRLARQCREIRGHEVGVWVSHRDSTCNPRLAQSVITSSYMWLGRLIVEYGTAGGGSTGDMLGSYFDEEAVKLIAGALLQALPVDARWLMQ